MKIVASILLALVVIAGNLRAADPQADFAAANKLYAEGKFSDAARAYDALRAQGIRTTALLFNDANAHFKAGHLGQAIAAYRQAALLAPRNAEIKANLDFVRKQVPGPSVGESRWLSGLNFLSLNEWTLLTAIAFWLTFAFLIARQIRPAVAAPLKKAALYCAVLALGCGSALAIETSGHLSAGTAVIISSEATARSGPFDEAQSVFTAHDGAELAVLDRHGAWVQVTEGGDKIGWLPARLVSILPGA